MQPLTNTILQCYNDFCQINGKRLEKFFIQLRADCFNLYSEKMQTAFDAAKLYFEEADLQKLHKNAEDKALAMVCFVDFPKKYKKFL